MECKRLSQSIFYKIFTPLFILTTGTAFYLWQVWVPALVDDNIKQSERHIEKSLQSVSEALVPLVLEDQLSNVYETLDALKEQNPNWIEIQLDDSKKRSLYPLVSKELVADGFKQKKIKHTIKVDDQVIGYLTLVCDFSVLVESIQQQGRGLLFVMLTIVLAFAFVMTQIIKKHISQPVRRLISATGAIAKGDLDKPVMQSPHLSLELKQLIQSFEQMRLNIQSSQENLIQSNEKLKEEKIKSEQANFAKSQFLANMSHEIRTPLNGIIGLLDLLQKGEMNDQQKEFLRIASQSSELLLSIITDILEISKIESGKLSIESRDFDLRQSLESLVEVFSGKIYEKDLEFIVDLSEELPAMINGDEARINQVLLNLLGNSIKFTPTGDISLNVYPKGDWVHFEVVDTGVGIPQAKLNTIFEAFSQADISDTRKYGGSGLGLSISKQIIEAMGGEIQVTSQESQGSCFSFKIPRNYNSEKPCESAVLDESSSWALLVKNQKQESKLNRKLEFWGAKVHLLNQLQDLKSLCEDSKNTWNLVVDSDSLQEASLESFLKMDLSLEKKVLMSSPLQHFEMSNRYQEDFDAFLVKPVRDADLFKVINSKKQKKQKVELMEVQDVSEDLQEQAIKVLLVEDNLVNQVVAKSMFTEMGLTCEVANNGQEAVEKCKDQIFDIVFMDCQMPVMDGFAATQEIRKLPENQMKDVPIVAMTASAFRSTKEECFASGMNDFFTKPVKISTLENVIVKYCHSKKKTA